MVDGLKDPVHEPRLGVERFLREHFFHDGRLVFLRRKIVERGKQVHVRAEGLDVAIGRQPRARLDRCLEWLAIAIKALVRHPKFAIECLFDFAAQLLIFPARAVSPIRAATCAPISKPW